ncbi:hypothetical protein [Amycolatopsis magusensis]
MPDLASLFYPVWWALVGCLFLAMPYFGIAALLLAAVIVAKTRK